MSLRTNVWTQMAILLLGFGCGHSNHDAALLLHILSSQREACEHIGSSLADAWSDAIDGHIVEPEEAMADFLASPQGIAHSAYVEARKRQSSPLLASTNSASAEVRGALVDLASALDAYCTLTRDPTGFSLFTFNQTRAEKRVELDRILSRASLLVGTVDIAESSAALDREALEISRAAGQEKQDALDREAEEQRLAEAREAELRAKEAAAALRREREHAAWEAEVAAIEEAQRAAERMEAEMARRAQTRDRCRNSVDWRRNWAKTFYSVAYDSCGKLESTLGNKRSVGGYSDSWREPTTAKQDEARARTCSQFEKEATGLLQTKPPVAIQGYTGSLIEALQAAQRACMSSQLLAVAVATKRCADAGATFARFEAECEGMGL